MKNVIYTGRTIS